MSLPGKLLVTGCSSTVATNCFLVNQRAKKMIRATKFFAQGVKNFVRSKSTAKAPAYHPQRVVNLSAGCAALPIEVLERAAKEMNRPLGKEISVTEMGYRTSDFHVLMDTAEDNFRKLMNVPDNYEIHFFNGGATLQFAAIPLNLLGVPENNRKATYIMSGHWSEKAHKEAAKYTDPYQVCVDPEGLYFDFPDGKDWNIPKDSHYAHYTSADTRQGFEFQDFEYDAVPENTILCCDASANLGSKPVDISKYGVIYAAAHKNFSTSGVCYTVIRKDLIDKDVSTPNSSLCSLIVIIATTMIELTRPPLCVLFNVILIFLYTLLLCSLYLIPNIFAGTSSRTYDV